MPPRYALVVVGVAVRLNVVRSFSLDEAAAVVVVVLGVHLMEFGRGPDELVVDERVAR